MTKLVVRNLIYLVSEVTSDSEITWEGIDCCFSLPTGKNNVDSDRPSRGRNQVERSEKLRDDIQDGMFRTHLNYSKITLHFPNECSQ